MNRFLPLMLAALIACDTAGPSIPPGACRPQGEFGTAGCASISGTIGPIPNAQDVRFQIVARPSPERVGSVASGLDPSAGAGGLYSIRLIRWRTNDAFAADTMTATLVWAVIRADTLSALDSAFVSVTFAPEGAVPTAAHFDIVIPN